MTNEERVRWGLDPLPKEWLSPTDVKRLWLLRSEGMQRVEIAQTLGTTVNVVRNVVSRRGLYKHPEYDPPRGKGRA